jgi:sporulation protein YlmC with PRC-barrel domain
MIDQSDLSRIMGADVYAPDGEKIGSASQVYLDDRSGDPEWIAVRTGLFGTKESFVPLSQANLSADRINVPFDKDIVKGAPRIDADGDLSPAEEDELYTYYGMRSSEGVLSGSVCYGFGLASAAFLRVHDGS